ncbi:MAG: AAA family ATPase [Pyrinomonadaceae bacterium]|nr:AAA family ATPase [Pyrinomonadaceae bacterium]MBP6211679.1 AAA family ATPase [Pyrinomonadaceae bacterium]
MYKEFFGLDDTPFTLTPDPRFIVFTPSYNEVLASLYYGLENAKGLIVLTGEVGTGKTTALRWILRRLDASVLAAYVFNPRLSIDEFYHHVTQMLGIKDWSNKAELLSVMGKVLEERHRRGLRTVIIIDEAHELSDYVLEEIRLLLNFESDDAKHLQIVLTGQPELRDKLNQPNLRQLKQRVALRCNMHAYPNVDEVERYITERLMIAGSDRPSVFTNGAIELIFQCSEGIPRNINNLCDNAMLTAYGAGELTIGRKVIAEVAENLDLMPQGQYAAKPLAVQTAPSPGVGNSDKRESVWNGRKISAEPVRPRMFQADAAKGLGQTSKKVAVDNDYFELDFDELESDHDLDGKEVGGFY